MKVRLVVDVGVRDGMRWPLRGNVVDLPEEQARAVVAAGEAVPVPRGTLVDQVLTPVELVGLSSAKGPAAAPTGDGVAAFTPDRQE